MGCSKNRVDSEHLLRVLQQRGCTLVPETADLADGGVDEVIINTCGFIQDAKEESIAAILEAAEAKKAGLIEKLSVFGCLSQRYPQELRAEIPEVDADDAPHAARYLITVRYYLPFDQNPNARKRQIARALFDAGCTWPSITNISDREGQAYALECEWADGGGYYGTDQP
jgi:tRNA A37 methylthiotransferase MiaB